MSIISYIYYCVCPSPPHQSIDITETCTYLSIHMVWMNKFSANNVLIDFLSFPKMLQLSDLTETVVVPPLLRKYATLFIQQLQMTTFVCIVALLLHYYALLQLTLVCTFIIGNFCEHHALLLCVCNKIKAQFYWLHLYLKNIELLFYTMHSSLRPIYVCIAFKLSVPGFRAF